MFQYQSWFVPHVSKNKLFGQNFVHHILVIFFHCNFFPRVLISFPLRVILCSSSNSWFVHHISKLFHMFYFFPFVCSSSPSNMNDFFNYSLRAWTFSKMGLLLPGYRSRSIRWISVIARKRPTFREVSLPCCHLTKWRLLHSQGSVLYLHVYQV